MSKLPDPKMDGIDHIRIDLYAASRLGCKLPLLADVKVSHPVHGKFRTGQGLWVYLKIGKKKAEELRMAEGFEAKEIGADFSNLWVKTLKDDIKIAMRSKIEDNIEIFVPFLESTLPFRYYHISRKKVIEPKETKWIGEWLSELREEFKAIAAKVK